MSTPPIFRIGYTGVTHTKIKPTRHEKNTASAARELSNVQQQLAQWDEWYRQGQETGWQDDVPPLPTAVTPSVPQSEHPSQPVAPASAHLTTPNPVPPTPQPPVPTPGTPVPQAEQQYPTPTQQVPPVYGPPIPQQSEHGAQQTLAGPPTGQEWSWLPEVQPPVGPPRVDEWG